MIRATKRQILVLLLAGLAALLATATAAADPTRGKRAEAEAVLAQIQEIDASLGHAVEAYNAAEIELEAIESDQRENTRHLRIARGNLTKAQAAISNRVVALYTGGEFELLEILLGASSLDELLARVDTVNRVSEQDSRIVKEIRTFRREIRKRKAELERAQAEQQRVVSERAARRAAIESQLAERRRLLASIEDEIERIEAREAARQRQLAAQARDRLASQPAASVATSAAGTVAGGATEAVLSYGTPPPARYGGVVGIAMQYLGVPYVWGGASPSGFDCSGFILYVYAKIGVSLPHNAAMQYGYGTPVSRDQLEPGDLVFFNGLGHNGLYIGGGQFIHAPHTGDVVKISSLSDSWYASTWVGARRL